MRKTILIVFPILLHGFLFSQNKDSLKLHLIDSLTTILKTDSAHIYRFQKYRPFLNIDQRNSFIRQQPINVYGGQGGILINDRHTFGFGGYAITARSKQIIKIKTDQNIPANRTLNLDYATFFYLLTIFDKRFIEIDAQAEVGGGKYIFKFYDENNGKQIAERSGGLFVGGISPVLTIKPTHWIGITGMIGYRFTSEKNTKLNFNGLFYSYGVWLDARQIIRDCNYYLIKKRKYKKQIID
jgi:hypothetical protein